MIRCNDFLAILNVEIYAYENFYVNFFVVYNTIQD